MTTSELSRFWTDVVVSYTQVALNHEREVVVSSHAEDLTATVKYDSVAGKVTIDVFTWHNEPQLKRESEVEQ
jgi:hypothetical protein